VFFSTQIHSICFHKYISISHFIKWNEIFSFLIYISRLYSNIIWKKLWNSFKSLRLNIIKHSHAWKVVQCETLKEIIGMCFHTCLRSFKPLLCSSLLQSVSLPFMKIPTFPSTWIDFIFLACVKGLELKKSNNLIFF